MKSHEQQKFTIKEWEQFFDWLAQKYGISEETYYTYDDDFCNAREAEFVSIAESYGHKFVAKEQTPPACKESSVFLYNADPNCDHNIVACPEGGVKCTKCNGWFAY